MVAHLKGTMLVSAAVATALGALFVARKMRDKQNATAFSPIYPDTTEAASAGHFAPDEVNTSIGSTNGAGASAHR